MSSMSCWLAIHAAICVVDCSMAKGHIMPVKKASTTVAAISSTMPWNVCFRMNVRQTASIITMRSVCMCMSVVRVSCRVEQ